RDRALVARRPREALHETVEQQHTIREARERVMKRLMREKLGRQLPLGDVATRNHDPGNDGIVGSVGLYELEPAPRSLRVSRADIPLAARARPLQHLQ